MCTLTYLIVFVMVKCDFVFIYFYISKYNIDVSTFKMNSYIYLHFQVKVVKIC